MIGKHTKGKHPYHVLKYVLEKPGAELLTTHLLPQTSEVKALSNALELSWQQNHRIQRPVYHASISVQQAERLDDATWQAIAKDYLTRMEFGRVPYVVVRHTDTDHDHIHIVAGRCNLDTNRCVKDNWDHLRSRKVLKELEREYGLVPTTHAWETGRNPTTVGMVRQGRRTGKKAVKEQLQDLIDGICQQPVELTVFANSLQQQGVTLILAPTPTGKPGITYQYNNIHFSGSQLGRDYTLNGLRTYKAVSSPTSDDALWSWWNAYCANHNQQASVTSNPHTIKKPHQSQLSL